MLLRCQEGTGLLSQCSGVRGEYSIRPNVPYYMRAAQLRAMMSVPVR